MIKKNLHHNDMLIISKTFRAMHKKGKGSFFKILFNLW